jgi:hypothetical protein
MDVIRGDRRSDRRYQISLRFLYEVRLPDGSLRRGSGWTRNLSGGGVLLNPDFPFDRGDRVYLWIDWPRKLQDRFPLELVAEGDVVRSDDEGAAVRITHYELRTKGSRAFHQSTQPVPKVVAVG